jgi:hypothetical protein
MMAKPEMRNATDTVAQTGAPAGMPPVENGTIDGVHPLMISSLPPIASGADVYSRQFYRGGRLPLRRYLPVTVK